MTYPLLRQDAPATYRIRVQGYLPGQGYPPGQGHLDDSGLQGLEGLTLTKDNRAGQAPQITLSGRFADQGALIRMLDDLLDQGLELLSVEYLAAEPLIEVPVCGD
jgi:hypothetical protein